MSRNEILFNYPCTNERMNERRNVARKFNRASYERARREIASTIFVSSISKKQCRSTRVIVVIS